MTTRRWSDVLRGIAGSALLAFLVLGVPYLLVTGIGWPLWESVPDVSRALDLLDDGLPDRAFLNIVTCLAWIVWVQFTVALVAEIVATVQGRATGRVTGVPAGMQSAAGRLVAVALLVGVAFASRGPEQVTPLPAPDQVRPDTVLVDDSLDTPVTARADAGTTAEAGPREWVVNRRDTLWGIAETTLGDGARYGEILQLNRNRPQPAGGALRAATDRLQPGWRLQLPADAVLPTDAPAAVDGTYVVQSGDSLSSIAHKVLGDRDRWPQLFELNRGRPQADGTVLTDPDVLSVGWRLEVPGGVPSAVEVRAGDTLSELADTHLGDAEQWPELYEANAGMPQPDGRVLSDPDQIDVGWTLDLPGPSTPAPGTAPAPPADPEPARVVDFTPENLDEEPAPDTAELAATTPEPASGGPIRPQAVTDAPQNGDDDEVAVAAAPSSIDDRTTFPAPPLGPTVAGGLVGLLAVLRARQRRRRRPDTVVPAPSDAARRLEAGLRSVADLDEVTLTELALRSLSGGLDEVPPTIGIRSITVRAGRLAVRLDRPLRTAPSGWQSDGATIVLDPTVDQDVLEALATRDDGRWAPVAAPALLPMGADTDGAATFVDVERLGALALDGDPSDVSAAVRGLLYAALSTPWAEECDLVVVGPAEVPAGLPWVRAVPTLAAAVDLLEERSRQVATALGDGPTTTVAARLQHADADLRPMVAIVRDAPAGDDPLVERIAALDATATGVAVVIGGAVPMVPNAAVRDGVVELPDGLAVRVPTLDAEQEAALAGLLRELTAEPVAAGTPRLVRAVDDDEPGAEIRVLGPIEVLVRGHAVRWKPHGALDLVTWLALHPGGGESLRSVVPFDEATWTRIVTEATIALGIDEQGRTRLADAGRGLRNATTDLARFRSLVASAESTGHVDLLDEALELVRGPVLGAGAERPVWAPAIADAVTDEVVAVAQRSAETHRALGEPDAERRALEAGLRADPGAEELWRRLLELTAEADGSDAAGAVAVRMRTAIGRSAGAAEPLTPETEAVLTELAPAERESA